MVDKYALKILPIASSDLNGIFDYIYNELSNPKAALDLLNKIDKGFETIKEFPLSCAESKLEKKYRKLIIDNFIAFYKVDEQNKTVIIFRVLYGMSDYEKQL